VHISKDGSLNGVNGLCTCNEENLPLIDGGALTKFEGQWKILLVVGKLLMTLGELSTALIPWYKP